MKTNTRLSSTLGNLRAFLIPLRSCFIPAGKRSQARDFTASHRGNFLQARFAQLNCRYILSSHRAPFRVVC